MNSSFQTDFPPPRSGQNRLASVPSKTASTVFLQFEFLCKISFEERIATFKKPEPDSMARRAPLSRTAATQLLGKGLGDRARLRDAGFGLRLLTFQRVRPNRPELTELLHRGGISLPTSFHLKRQVVQGTVLGPRVSGAPCGQGCGWCRSAHLHCSSALKSKSSRQCRLFVLSFTSSYLFAVLPLL